MGGTYSLPPSRTACLFFSRMRIPFTDFDAKWFKRVDLRKDVPFWV